jgi:ElaB/YqjD/DUF883 family membrane-anchored ribosome-binding protein
MTLSEQVDMLQSRVTELRSSLESSRDKAEERIRARADRAEGSSAPAEPTGSTPEMSGDKGETPRERWQVLKAEVSARLKEGQSWIDRKRDELDVTQARHAAEWAEADAYEALDFAMWAVDTAAITVVDAVDARVWAESRAAATPTT